MIIDNKIVSIKKSLILGQYEIFAPGEGLQAMHLSSWLASDIRLALWWPISDQIDVEVMVKVKTGIFERGDLC